MKELVNTNEQIKKLVCSTSLFHNDRHCETKTTQTIWTAKLWFKYQMLIQKSLSLWLLTWNTKTLFHLLIKVYPLKFGVNREIFLQHSAMEWYLVSTAHYQAWRMLCLIKRRHTWLTSMVEQKYSLNTMQAMDECSDELSCNALCTTSSSKF